MKQKLNFYLLFRMNYRHQTDNYKFVFLKLLIGLMWHFVQNEHQCLYLLAKFLHFSNITTVH
jgi:hypothetical protein